jgi:Protein of unknown function (DUF3078)
MKGKSIFFLLLVFVFIDVSYSKSKSDTTALNIWSPNIVVGLNISEIALSNWTQGGDNSVTWTLTGKSELDYYSKDWSFRNTMKAAYGRTKLDGQDFITGDNTFYEESVLARKIGWAVNPYVSNSVTTALTRGYDYSVTPPQIVANFFDPGYVTQSCGFTYDKHAWFKSRLGLATQEIFTNKYRQYSDNASTTNKLEAFKLATGFSSETDLKLGFLKNMQYNSSLRLFTRFERLDVWDVTWDNDLIAKINDYFNVDFTFLLIYQKDQSLKTQMKQTLQLGVVYSLI